MTGGIWDRAAADYERTGVAFFAPLGRRLVARAGVAAGERVLDLGCGRGDVLIPAATAVGPTGSVVGIDLSPAMVELTAAELRTRGLTHASVCAGDAAAPGPGTGTRTDSVDVVLGGFMMFLLPDPAAALSEYRRLLVPGGRLAFSTYGAPDPRAHEARTRLRRWAGLGADEDDVFDGPPDGIAALVESAGFVRVEIEESAQPVHFGDLEHWWRWAWSVGLRGALERIPPAALPDARADVADALAPARKIGRAHV